MIDDSLSLAMGRLRAEGYTADLRPTADGMLTCEECGVSVDPLTMQVDQTVRFEGPTDPGDESILLAVTCDCDIRGLYSTSYGPTTPADDTAVLRRFAQRLRRERRDAGH